MNEQSTQKRVILLRTLVQWGFFFWVAFIGLRFGMFVRHFESGGAAPFITRPAGVDGFLPIGALASLKYWLASGVISPLHPAALIIFLSVIVMSLLAKTSFCSWLCPVGTVCETAAKLGSRIFGRNFRIWRPLDVILRGMKYLILLFFVKVIIMDMPIQALGAFLNTPYWAVSDVKMLHFFTRMSATTIVVMAILAVLSLLYANFWCRYLCPYGALLGLVSVLSPFKIRRDSSLCTGCGSCSAACPAALPVHSRKVVRTPECSGCLNCTAACPEKDVLRMALSMLRRSLPAWVFPAVALLLFAAGIGTGMATGNWLSSLGYADYQQLIPMAPYLNH